MKKVASIIFCILALLVIFTVAAGLGYFNFLSLNQSLILLGILLMVYFIIPLFFNKPDRRKIRVYVNILCTGLFLVTLSTILLLSPGKPKPFKNSRGGIIGNSISAWEKIEIGGVNQWLLIKGENKGNPVVLYLSGGFGLPVFHLISNYYPQFEKDFTVAYWEQRGSGKSYSDSQGNDSFTFDQLTSDINEIAIYLRKRFNQEKIILVGHSWGTSIGLLASRRYPENFHFYLGTGQVVNSEMNMIARYPLILEQAKKENNLKAIHEINGLGIPPYKPGDQIRNDNILTKWADLFSVTEFSNNWSRIYNLSLLKCPEYTLSEKITNKSKNKLYLIRDDFYKLNLCDSSKIFKLPVYFIQGENDYLTTAAVVEKYYRMIDAPDKDMLVIKNCAHDAQIDFPKEFNDFLKEKYKKSLLIKPVNSPDENTDGII